MRVFRLRETLQRRGLTLLKHGDGWMVTNEGVAKTLIEHRFADIAEVEAWIAELPNRFTEEEAEVFDEEYTVFVNQCDGCRRRLPLVDGIHRGPGFDMIGCTKDRYEESDMRIEIEDTCYGDGSMKEVTFMADDREHTVQLPAELAALVKIRCEFRHGLNCDGRLTAVFRGDQDRDTARDFFENIYGDSVWEIVSL